MSAASRPTRRPVSVDFRRSGTCPARDDRRSRTALPLSDPDVSVQGMTAPESRDPASVAGAEQSTLTLVREDVSERPRAEESAAENSRSAAPARRKLWPA